VALTASNLDEPSVPLALALFTLASVIGGAVWMHVQYSRRTRELQASEERFRELFENAIEGVYENPPEGGFRRVNPTMARILGYATPEEVLRIPPERISNVYVSPTRRGEFFALLGANNDVANFESEIRRPDGSTAWIKENVRAIRDPKGRLLYLQGFVSDITERRKSEDALRASEERFRVLFQHSPLGIVEYDYQTAAEWFERLRGQGVTNLEAWLEDHPDELRIASSRVTIVGANAAALRLFGARNLAEGIARLDQIYTPDAYAARRLTFAAMWAGRTEIDGEITVCTLDGRLLLVYFRWRVPVIEGRPLFARTQLAVVDLTAVKSTENALAAERERLAVTLRAMTESVITTDPEGIVQFMNEAAGALSGWSPAAAIGRRLDEVFLFASGNPGGTVAPPVAAALSADRAIDLPPHAIVMPRTGPVRGVEGRCAPMHDLGGRAIGVVIVLRDVTDRARLEAELVRASKLESIGVLAGGIAHDFNNLLTVVLGNLTLALLDEKTLAAGGRWLREAERGTLRAKELTQQLLTFAKGGEPLRSTVRLPDIVREAAEFALHGSAVKCEFAFDPDLRPADVDKGQIGQVVQNLVINSLQAMAGGGVIRVALRNETLSAGAVAPLPGGEYIRLDISDTGRGIAPQHLARIFEPFFTTKESGTGLGLATVYSVVQKHGGHVTVESELGRGTAFHVWLPAARSEPAATTKSNTPFVAVRGRVLFMDDEEPIRVMTAALLERLGLDACMATDGAEAVREYATARHSNRPFDLVIMDLTVAGGMGGAAAMREILKIDPAARGIVSSGYSSDPVMANYRAHGFRAMVPKPYRMADFTRTIREVLSGE
jgi:PAS domain S-box-containing protein